MSNREKRKPADAFKELTIQHRIVDLKLNSFKLSVLDKAEQKKVIPNSIVFEFNVGVGINETEKTVKVDLLTKIFADKEKTLLVGEMDTSGLFEIVNMKDLIKEHKTLPHGIIVLLIGVLISTTRGFLLIKSQGTILEGSIIPIVNLDSFNRPGKGN
jgi:hypothetical protein